MSDVVRPKYRDRLRTRRLCCSVSAVALFYAATIWCATPDASGRLRGAYDGAVHPTWACDVLLAQHAAAFSAVEALKRRPRVNASSSPDAIDELADVALVASCLALRRGWRDKLEIAAGARSNESAYVVRGRGLAPLRSRALTPAQAKVALADAGPSTLDDGFGAVAGENSKTYDLAVVDGRVEPLGDLLRCAELALDALADGGALMVAHVDAGDAAWRLVALLRAREDVDAAGGGFDGGVAVAFKRPNSRPLAMEALTPVAMAALEWPPILPLSSKAPELRDAALPRPFFGPPLGPAALLRWAEPGAPPPFSPAALREARDAQHWRAACYGSLESDGRSAARPCFHALNRRSKTPNVHDLVPQALLDAAAGDAEGAADALERALESDARAAAALLAKAADALARP